MGLWSRRSIRLLGVGLAAAAAFSASRAGACTHKVWTPDDVSGGGLSFLFVQSTPFELATGWHIEVCYAIANPGGVATTGRADLLAWDASDTGLTFPIVGSHSEFISTPGNATPVTCSVSAGSIATIESIGAIPAGQVTDQCCFDYKALAPGTCDELPGQMTLGVGPNNLPVSFRDKAQVMLEAGGVPVADVTILLNGYVQLSGPACGLLGIEVAVPLVLASWRIVRRRRDPEGGR